MCVHMTVHVEKRIFLKNTIIASKGAGYVTKLLYMITYTTMLGKTL